MKALKRIASVVRERGNGGNALLFLLLALVLTGLFWTPYDPQAQQFRGISLSGPSPEHWLGVDPLGRDFLSRLWAGAASTLWMASGALGLTLLVAGTLLLLEQYGGRVAGPAVRLLTGLWIAVPVVVVGLILLVAFRPSAGVLVLAAGLGNVPLAFRQIRILWLEQVNAPYVEASRVIGSRGWRLLRRTILPNLLPDLTGLAKLVFAMAVLELSGLAFLGLSGDPDLPELGTILKQNQDYLVEHPQFVLLPGLILSGLLLAVHLSRGRV